MAGKPSIRVFEYDSEGQFVKFHDCINDARKEHYSTDIGKRPLFVKGPDIRIHELPNGGFLCKERIGRKGIQVFKKRKRSPYLKQNWRKEVHKQKPIQVVNVDGEIIAKFANVHVASRLLGKPHSSIHNALETDLTRDLLIWQQEEDN